MKIDDPISALQGQVQALSMTLTGVISSLDANAAARVGLSLEIARAETREDERHDPTEYAEVRDLVLDSVQGLLQSIVAQG